jgi:hypothetical protein
LPGSAPLPDRLQVSILETRRVGGKVRHEHIASVGSIETPLNVADRVAFWQRVHERLAKLSNRIDPATQGKILGDIDAQIPMVTPGEAPGCRSAGEPPGPAPRSDITAIRGLAASSRSMPAQSRSAATGRGGDRRPVVAPPARRGARCRRDGRRAAPLAAVAIARPAGKPAGPAPRSTPGPSRRSMPLRRSFAIWCDEGKERAVRPLHWRKF